VIDKLKSTNPGMSFENFIKGWPLYARHQNDISSTSVQSALLQL